MVFKLGTVMNASGCWCTTLDELNDLDSSQSDYIVTKSSTLEPRAGNPEPRFYCDGFGSINSMGIPNLGFDTYLKFQSQKSEKSEKPVIQSIYPFNPSELQLMLNRLNDVTHCKIVEINVTCPNLGNRNKHHLIEYLDVVEKYKSDGLTIGLKLEPMYYPDEFDNMEYILSKYQNYVNFVAPPSSRLIIKRNGHSITRQIPKPVVLVDTREKSPFDFSKYSNWIAEEKRQKLDAGDLISIYNLDKLDSDKRDVEVEVKKKDGTKFKIICNHILDTPYKIEVFKAGSESNLFKRVLIDQYKGDVPKFMKWFEEKNKLSSPASNAPLIALISSLIRWLK